MGGENVVSSPEVDKISTRLLPAVVVVPAVVPLGMMEEAGYSSSSLDSSQDEYNGFSSCTEAKRYLL